MVTAIKIIGPTTNRLQPHFVSCLQLDREGGRMAAVLVARGPSCNVETHSIKNVSVQLEVNDRVIRLHSARVELSGNDVDTGERRRVHAQKRIIAVAVTEDHMVKPERPGGQCCG